MGFRSKLTLRVRTYECDSYNHVNNAVYLHYLETARYEFLKDIGFNYPALIEKGYGIYVARVEIDYKKPALADEEITIESYPVKRGSVSGVIEQIIKRGEDVIAKANVTWAFIGKNGAPVKIPPEFDNEGLNP
jgi:acyl-CoA thioester hydrolase